MDHPIQKAPRTNIAQKRTPSPLQKAYPDRPKTPPEFPQVSPVSNRLPQPSAQAKAASTTKAQASVKNQPKNSCTEN
jgi:hypothetical protein